MCTTDVKESFLLMDLPVISHKYLNWDLNMELGCVLIESSVSSEEESEEEESERKEMEVVNQYHEDHLGAESEEIEGEEQNEGGDLVGSDKSMVEQVCIIMGDNQAIGGEGVQKEREL